MRIAILTHSTNPRGGVVHALELADALCRQGHRPAVLAPDPSGAGFFRKTICRTVSVPAEPYTGALVGLVEQRIDDYARYLSGSVRHDFDLFHAQDGISGNALATLKQRGLIGGFARTVHHIDSFADPRLDALQTRSILAADRHFTVSRVVAQELRDRFAIRARLVGNGVDRRRYTDRPDGREPALRDRLGLGSGPVFLAVGGVERRKNTNRIVEAFLAVLETWPTAQLVIAGGASLLDHGAYQQQFADLAPGDAVIRTGPIADDDMPALYRICDALVFPSVQEGFGLAVIEAMASGIPVVTARIAPFTEYLAADDVAWCEPSEVLSIAAAMSQVLDARLRSRLIASGYQVAARHDWARTARAHLRDYETLTEALHA